MSWIPSYKKPSGGGYTPPSWSDGTDEEIVSALEAHYNDEIDLTEYWAVGDERIVTLNNMPASNGEYQKYSQPVAFVLMNVGGKTLTTPINGHTECAFVVGQKDLFAKYSGSVTGGPIHSSSTTINWGNCNKRSYCNNYYYSAIPSSIKSIFKQFKNQQSGPWGTAVEETDDYIALPSEKEIFGTTTYANNNAETNLTQFEYYKTSENRIKKQFKDYSNIEDFWDDPSWWEAQSYWTRTRADRDSPQKYVYIHNSGGASTAAVTTGYNWAPFGVI